MWGWLRNKLGLARIERKIDMANSKIADLAPILQSIADDVTPLSTGLAGVLSTLQQLQQNAANPSNDTTLSSQDQANLDAAVLQATTLKTAFDGILNTLPQAQAAVAAAAPTA